MWAASSSQLPLYPRPFLYQRRPPPPLRLAFPRPKQTFLSVSASASFQNPRSSTLSSLLKSLASTLALSAALLSFSFRLPPRALALPPPISTTLPADEDLHALRSLLENHLRDKKIPEALDVLDRLILLQKDDYELLIAKAQLLDLSGEAAAARTVFEEILQKDPLAVEAYHGLVVLLLKSTGEESAEVGAVMRRVEKAMDSCKKEGKKKELRNLMLLTAQVKMLKGELDTALGLYGELVKEDPEDFRPYLCRGILYTLLRRKEEAQMQFDEYRRRIPKEHPFTQYIERNMSLMRAMMMKKEQELGAGAQGR